MAHSANTGGVRTASERFRSPGNSGRSVDSVGKSAHDPKATFAWERVAIGGVTTFSPSQRVSTLARRYASRCPVCRCDSPRCDPRADIAWQQLLHAKRAPLGLPICRDKGNQTRIERLFLDIAGHDTQIDYETADLCHPCQGVVFDAAGRRPSRIERIDV